MLTILFIWLISFMSVSGMQSDTTSIASKPVTIRSFDQTKLEELKNHDDFDYTQSRIAEDPGIWSKIKRLINQMLNWFFRKLFNINAPEISSWILIGILAISTVFILIKVLDINFNNNVFISSDVGNIDYTVEEENIHEMDFNKLIDEAVRQSAYRTAIRYLYLFALKKLSDKQKIVWVPGKTNQEYEHELKSDKLQASFSQLGYFFEYAWYGEFDIKTENFQKAHGVFRQLEEELMK